MNEERVDVLLERERLVGERDRLIVVLRLQGVDGRIRVRLRRHDFETIRNRPGRIERRCRAVRIIQILVGHAQERLGIFVARMGDDVRLQLLLRFVVFGGADQRVRLRYFGAAAGIGRLDGVRSEFQRERVIEVARLAVFRTGFVGRTLRDLDGSRVVAVIRRLRDLHGADGAVTVHEDLHGDRTGADDRRGVRSLLEQLGRRIEFGRLRGRRLRQNR